MPVNLRVFDGLPQDDDLPPKPNIPVHQRVLTHRTVSVSSASTFQSRTPAAKHATPSDIIRTRPSAPSATASSSSPEPSSTSRATRLINSMRATLSPARHRNRPQQNGMYSTPEEGFAFPPPSSPAALPPLRLPHTNSGSSTRTVTPQHRTRTTHHRLPIPSSAPYQGLPNPASRPPSIAQIAMGLHTSHTPYLNQHVRRTSGPDGIRLALGPTPSFVDPNPNPDVIIDDERHLGLSATYAYGYTSRYSVSYRQYASSTGLSTANAYRDRDSHPIPIKTPPPSRMRPPPTRSSIKKPRNGDDSASASICTSRPSSADGHRPDSGPALTPSVSASYESALNVPSASTSASLTSVSTSGPSTPRSGFSSLLGAVSGSNAKHGDNGPRIRVDSSASASLPALDSEALMVQGQGHSKRMLTRQQKLMRIFGLRASPSALGNTNANANLSPKTPTPSSFPHPLSTQVHNATTNTNTNNPPSPYDSTLSIPTSLSPSLSPSASASSSACAFGNGGVYMNESEGSGSGSGSGFVARKKAVRFSFGVEP